MISGPRARPLGREAAPAVLDLSTRGRAGAHGRPDADNGRSGGAGPADLPGVLRRGHVPVPVP